MYFIKLRTILKTTGFFISFLVLFVSCSISSFALQLKNLTVLAEPNMVGALTKISRIYSQKNGIIISVSFAPSGELISDIEAGEPSDVFISAHHFWIDNLKQKGLVDIYNIGHIANDSLVLVTSKDNKNMPEELLVKNLNLVKALEILNQNNAILIVDHDGSSLGQYSEYLLKNMDLKSIQIFKKLYEDRTSIANLLNNNHNSYTILLASQIKNHDEFMILSDIKSQHIFYQALVIAGDNMDTAREFLRFLKSKQAKDIFEENGFMIEK